MLSTYIQLQNCYFNGTHLPPARSVSKLTLNVSMFALIPANASEGSCWGRQMWSNNKGSKKQTQMFRPWIQRLTRHRDVGPKDKGPRWHMRQSYWLLICVCQSVFTVFTCGESEVGGWGAAGVAGSPWKLTFPRRCLAAASCWAWVMVWNSR